MQNHSTSTEPEVQPEPENPLAGFARVDAALWWAEMGVSVFPLFDAPAGVCSCPDGAQCDSPGKHPRVSGGVKAATTEPEQITEWWSSWPNSNLGGATGSGLHVIDIDCAEGEVNLDPWKCPPTMETSTAKGRHLYYVEPPGFDAGNTQGGRGPRHLGVGIDTRGRGGYVVLPPSVHKSGHVYTLTYRDAAELPGAVVERLQSAPVSKDDPMDVEHRAVTPLANSQFATMLTYACERIANASEGSRHSRILNGVRHVAGYYHLQGALGATEVLQYIDQAVDRAYSTDRGRAGGYRTARDGWRDGLGEPYSHLPGQLQHTPDDRPYVVAVDGKKGMFVATRGTSDNPGAFVYQDTTLVVPRLRREWPGLPLWTPKASGEGDRPMTPVEALERFGDAWSDRVQYTYRGASGFDEDTGIITISSRFRRPPEPVEHKGIARWLELLPADPEDHGILLDWLATFPQIMKPTSALVLTGPGSVGKSLLVSGLCDYFGVAPVSYDTAVQQFNEELRHSPVVWLDESTKAHGQSAHFRRLTGNDRHRIEGKNKPTAILIGCPRSLAFANGDDPFGVAAEDLTADAEHAIGLRLRHIPVSAKAALHLRALGGRAYTEGNNWSGKLAGHVAWLAETRDVPPGDRLLVPGDAAKWAREIASRHGHAGQILQLVADEYAKIDPSKPPRVTGGSAPAVLHGGDGTAFVWVTNNGVRGAWNRHFAENAPSHVVIGKALRRLSRQDKHSQLTIKGTRYRVFPVPLDLLDNCE